MQVSTAVCAMYYLRTSWWTEQFCSYHYCATVMRLVNDTLITSCKRFKERDWWIFLLDFPCLVEEQPPIIFAHVR